jgi:MFS family permease
VTTTKNVYDPADATGHKAEPADPTTPRGLHRRPRGYLTEKWRPIVRVLLPFAVGFYLTNLFRTINALISDQLTSDLALGAADLGLLTSVYFLTFAAAQIPIGILLDRYGPRRVESALLLVAAGGAAFFGASQAFVPLVLARALIGLGVAAALTAGVKAIVLWFPKERVALVNGYLMMLGTLGAVTATAPAELLLAWTGWRGLFDLLALATAATAVLIYFVVPEVECATSASNGSEPVSLKTVYSDLRFWRLAPISATSAGIAWALQGLWAAPWLTDVEGLDRAGVIRHLFIMAVALTIGALLLGTAADRLRRRGIGPQTQLAVVAIVFIAAQLALILRLPLPSHLPWSIVAAAGAVPVLSYAILAEYFPRELAGRANGALTLFHFGGAFVLQYAIGLVLQHWTSLDGHYPVIAYQVAFGINFRAPDIAYRKMSGFGVAHGSVAVLRSPGAPGKASPIRGG